MDSLPNCNEGPEAASRFDKEVRFLLSVPRETMVRREKVYRRKVDANPKRRGPKRKSDPIADGVTASETIR